MQTIQLLGLPGSESFLVASKGIATFSCSPVPDCFTACWHLDGYLGDGSTENAGQLWKGWVGRGGGWEVTTGPWGISRKHGQGRGWVSLGSGGWDSVLSMSAEHLTCARLVSLSLTVSFLVRLMSCPIQGQLTPVHQDALYLLGNMTVSTFSCSINFPFQLWVIPISRPTCYNILHLKQNSSLTLSSYAVHPCPFLQQNSFKELIILPSPMPLLSFTPESKEALAPPPAPTLPQVATSSGCWYSCPK